MLIHARRPRFSTRIHSGDAFLSRFEGDMASSET